MATEARPKDFLDRLDGWVGRAESVLLVVIVGVMIGLASLQFFLRILFDFGFEWADIVVRQMVLWLGFVGGALATHKGRHIAIDVAQKFLSPRLAAWVRTLNCTAAAVIAGILMRASLTFIHDEIKNGTTLFEDFPSWPFLVVIPAAFVAIAFHFLVTAKNNLLVALGKRAPVAPSEEI